MLRKTARREVTFRERERDVVAATKYQCDVSLDDVNDGRTAAGISATCQDDNNGAAAGDICVSGHRQAP